MFMQYRFSNQTEKHNESLKMLAFIFMFFSMVGNLFFPKTPLVDAVGSFALPIFSYHLAKGYHNTTNLKKYFFRLWIFALMAQIPFAFVYYTMSLDILFGYILALFLIDRFEHKEYSWFPLILVVGLFAHIQFFLLPILMPLVYYLFLKKKLWAFVCQTIILIGYALLTKTLFMIFALWGVWVTLYIPEDFVSLKINKYFFYWAYPLMFVFFSCLKIIKF